MVSVAVLLKRTFTMNIVEPIRFCNITGSDSVFLPSIDTALFTAVVVMIDPLIKLLFVILVDNKIIVVALIALSASLQSLSQICRVQREAIQNTAGNKKPHL